MKTHIIRIGNSQGIRIPKALLEECGLEGEVELESRPGRLLVRAARAPRQGWEAAFQEMARQGHDQLVPSVRLPTTRWDATEWRW